MNRRDYLVVAEGLRKAKPQAQAKLWQSWVVTCQIVADTLKEANANMDRDKFMERAGVNES